MKAVVYRHIRLDTNKVFYVGIAASRHRPHSRFSRNKYWHNIVDKVGYDVEIITDKIPYEDACELEQFLISEYGRKDLGTGLLVNMTGGGEGSVNLSREVRDKISNSKLGTKLSKETRDKISKTLLDKNITFKHSNLTKSKISKANSVSKRKEVILVNTGKIFKSVLEASILTGEHKSNIGRSCRNNKFTKSGLKFNYI